MGLEIDHAVYVVWMKEIVRVAREVGLGSRLVGRTTKKTETGVTETATDWGMY